MTHDNVSPQIAAFQNSLAQPTSLPPPKRYITAHDEKTGKSVIIASPALKYRGHESVGGVARSYCSTGLPTRLDKTSDVDAYFAESGPTSYTSLPLCNPTGTNLTVAELQPGQCSQFHRTCSLDYVICAAGRIVLELDSGDKVELGPGDHVVQRGTMHKWWNASQTEPCRLIAVVVGAVEGSERPDGKGGVRELKEEHVEGSEKGDFDSSKIPA